MNIVEIIKHCLPRCRGYNPIVEKGGLQPDKPGGGLTFTKLGDRARLKSSRILADLERQKRENRLP